MHSVRRVKTSAEQRELRRKKEAVEIQKFKKLNDLVLSRSSDKDALTRTSQLLTMNPEHYTVWNIRRELLKSLDKESQAAAFTQDLRFTESLLPTHPKVYWIWNHRRWILSELSKIRPNEEAWGRELAMVTKLLERDSRNFHGWSYRHWVVVTNPEVSTPEKEFAFTTKKINENFSNYSAWHCRAQLITQLESKPTLQSELDYVYEAVAMDPQDQSGWLYYQWLLESPLFQSEINEHVLADQRELVAQLWDEESSVWAGRLLCELTRLQGGSVDPKLVEELATLDPLRKQRYQDLLAR